MIIERKWRRIFSNDKKVISNLYLLAMSYGYRVGKLGDSKEVYLYLSDKEYKTVCNKVGLRYEEVEL